MTCDLLSMVLSLTFNKWNQAAVCGNPRQIPFSGESSEAGLVRDSSGRLGGGGGAERSGCVCRAQMLLVPVLVAVGIRLENTQILLTRDLAPATACTPGLLPVVSVS